MTGWRNFLKQYKWTAVAFFLLAAPQAQAQISGLEKTAEKAGLKTTDAPGPATFAGQLVGAILAFVGVLFFLLVLYGGARWMFARGNAEEVKKAQEIIKTALLGMIIIFLAYILTRFVLTLITSATV